MFSGVSHTMIFVKDLNRAVNWYKDKLGFEINFVAKNAYASLRHEHLNFRLDLHPSEENGQDVGHGPMLYFSSMDIDKTINDLQAKEIKVGSPKQEGESHRFVTFWDCEGNALGVEETH